MHRNPTWRATAERPHDPPLSADGIIQAQETGARLARERIDHIFVSPFLRTVETAWHIAERLDLPISIEHGLCEMLLAEWFSAMPEFLPVEEMARRFSRVNTAYHSVHQPVYPEIDITLRARSREDAVIAGE